MKKTSLLFLTFVLLWITSCKNTQDVTPDDPASIDDFSTVPSAVVEAIKTTYPEATNLTFSEIEKNKVWDSQFSLSAIPQEAKIDVKGNILEMYSVAATNSTSSTDGGTVTLPAAAEAYITKTYAGYKIVASGQGEYNKVKAYKVTLRNDKEEVTIIFDEKGTVLIEFKATISNPTNPETPKSYPLVKADDLTEAINKYLKDNGLAFAKGVVTIDKDNKKTYYIVATKGTTIYELTFDNDSKLTKSSSYTPPPAPTAIKAISELPAAAVTYLAGYTLVSGTLVVDKNGKKTYTVVVTKDGKKYEVSFDGDGKVLRSTFVPPSPQVIKSASDLPATIATYLKDYSFVTGLLYYDKQGNKLYDVTATKGGITTYFTFNADGKVLSTIIMPKEVKSTSDLPEVVAKYLKDNGYTLVKGVIVFDKDGKQTITVSAKKDSDTYELVFDNSGKLVKATKYPSLPSIQEKSLSSGDVPKVIVEYLNNTYKTWTFMKGIASSLNGKVTGYIIVIQVNSDLYYLYFDGEGKFQAAKKG
ncbi:MAG: PepSY-like domain-containing protein [Spirosomataceae bacterium]